ncbi:monovalent cation/H+ antiporter subunit D [Sedimentimonas flavescens]|uniref:monovalent cation/H+ antiporter subunit D n=1 Tax=Sedimentimonas flavescens TaxID=2851012 RepID=UPI0021A36621|nr:monovalent cation/H+ antiporter subunit D [Sedimentimonas flavescens]MCT2539893.1 monovalent cation/H+ antiporter subunit D [Sedimentimonas flavescens]
MDHWIVAPVVLPAFLAPLIVLWMRFDLRSQRVFSVAGMTALVALAIALAVSASTNGPEVYRLGNWEAPFGIVLVLDRLSALMLLLTSVLGLAVVLYSIGSGWDKRGWHFHSLMQFQMMGINGAFLTGDAFNLFVFFEVLLIASYGLMIHSGGEARLKAGVQYVVYNLAGSTLFLFALGTIYSVTGTLNMADLAQKVAVMPASETGLLRVGAGLLMLVFAVKAALVPFQFWLPATYTNAPGPVAALFAIMTKVGVYAIVRIYTLVFPAGGTIGWLAQEVLLPAAAISLIIGMIGVLGARDMGRTVAYSVIGSVGTMMLAFAQFTEGATGAGLYYMVHSTLAAAALFLIVDLVRERRGAAGLAITPVPPIRNAGLIAGMFFAGAIAMAGMPPLSGFIGKLMILDATRGQWWLWGVVLVTSLIAIVGFGRAGSTVFWKAHAAAGDQPEPTRDASSPGLAFTATGGLIAGLVALTVFAGPTTAWLNATAQQLYTPSAYIDAVMVGAYERAWAATSGHEDSHANEPAEGHPPAEDHGTDAPAEPASGY